LEGRVCRGSAPSRRWQMPFIVRMRSPLLSLTVVRPTGPTVSVLTQRSRQPDDHRPRHGPLRPGYSEQFVYVPVRPTLASAYGARPSQQLFEDSVFPTHRAIVSYVSRSLTNHFHAPRSVA